MRIELCLEIDNKTIKDFLSYSNFYGYTPEKMLNILIINFIQKQKNIELEHEFDLINSYLMVSKRSEK